MEVRLEYGELVRSSVVASPAVMFRMLEELSMFQEARAHSQGVPSQGTRVDLAEEEVCVWEEARARSPVVIFLTMFALTLLGGVSVCLEAFAPSRVVQYQETQLWVEEEYLCKAGCARSRRHASPETKL